MTRRVGHADGIRASRADFAHERQEVAAGRLYTRRDGWRYPPWREGAVYIRLHGDEELYRSAYIEDALTRWAERIRLWSQGAEPSDARRISPKRAGRTSAREVYCYFDNTDKVEAPANALRLMHKLGIAWPVETRSRRPT